MHLQRRSFDAGGFPTHNYLDPKSMENNSLVIGIGPFFCLVLEVCALECLTTDFLLGFMQKHTARVYRGSRWRV